MRTDANYRGTQKRLPSRANHGGFTGFRHPPFSSQGLRSKPDARFPLVVCLSEINLKNP